MGWFKNLFKKKKKKVVIQKPSRKIETVGLIVGHTKRAGGAYSDRARLNEYDFHSVVIPRMKILWDAYIKSHIITRDNRGIEGASNVANAMGCDCTIEFHFNCYNGSASGREALVIDGHENSKLLANYILSEMGKKRPYQNNRGVKEMSRGNRGFYNLEQCNHGTPINVLLESFFGDNEYDAQTAEEFIESFKFVLVDAIKAYNDNV